MQIKNILRYIQRSWRAHKVSTIIIFSALVMPFLMDFPSLIAKPETVWGAYYINSSLTSNQAHTLVDRFKNDYLKEENEYHEYIFDTNINFSVYEGGAEDLDQMAKFTALIAAKALDFVITDEKVLSHYVSLGGFLDLEAFFNEDDLNVLNDHLVYMVGKDGVEKPYALDLSGTRVSISGENEDMVLGAIPLNAERTDITENFIRYIFNLNN